MCIKTIENRMVLVADENQEQNGQIVMDHCVTIC